MISGFLPLILLYPETHYRFRRFPFSKYYKKEPEIIVDLPYKSSTGRFPVFVIVKDSDKFPVTVWEAALSFMFEDGTLFRKTFLIQKEISSRLEFLRFEMDFGERKGFAALNAEIHYYCRGKLMTALNDNLKGPVSHLEIFLNDDEELFDGFVQGDLHYHSDYTSDQVEFGAPLEAAKLCAGCIGMDFFAVTDHSYDLDDMKDDYLTGDPELAKFREMREECSLVSDGQVALYPAEEITVSNSKGKNVHLLSFGDEFFYGSGDSAEKWLRTRSENSIADVAQRTGGENLLIAAHPFAATPLLQKLLVNRGSWSTDDIKNNGISHIQILNGAYDEDFFKSLGIWIKMLLNGDRIFITAGNDAHGNFNVFRQVRIPMLSLVSADRQIFGKCRTVVFSASSGKDEVMKALGSGACYITDGPHVLFSVSDGNGVYDIGSDFRSGGEILSAEFFITSSLYSGPVKGIVIYRGSIHGFEEKIVYKKQLVDTVHTFNDKIEYPNDRIDHYLRIEVYSSVTHGNGRQYEHRAYSNPIWIRK